MIFSKFIVHSPCCGNVTDGRNHHENGSSIFHANSCDTEVDGRMDDDDSEEEGDENTMSYWHRISPVIFLLNKFRTITTIFFSSSSPECSIELKR
jgi:hypothetical protein